MSCYLRPSLLGRASPRREQEPKLTCSFCLSAGGPGIRDPCEREPTDVLCDLSAQQADTITDSAQVRADVVCWQQEGTAESELSSDPQRVRVSFTFPCDSFERRVVNVPLEVSVASAEKTKPKRLVATSLSRVHELPLIILN